MAEAPARAAALLVVRTLRDAGFTAYFAGGCVRDELLGLAPADYDVATDATPDQVSGLFRSASLVGKSFGVVIVRLGARDGLAERRQIEVATFRVEWGYADGRRPDTVRFSTAEQDAQRRDITLNALFLDPSGVEGREVRLRTGATVRGVIDFVGGVSDLERGVVRAVGEPAARLGEDHLRALRCVRFAARLGFQIDHGTARAIREHASALRGVSAERIGDEVRRMLAHRQRATAARLLDELALTPAIMADVERRSGTLLEALPTSGGGDAPSLPACLAAWGHDLFPNEAGESVARRLREALVLSNEQAAAVRGALGGFAALREGWADAPVCQQKRWAGSGWFADAMTLFSADDPVVSRAVWARVEGLAATESGISPKPLLSGEDLIELGAKPGPVFRTTLEQIYDFQLEDVLRDRDTALDRARELLGIARKAD